jgi:hypothetical protein
MLAMPSSSSQKKCLFPGGGEFVVTDAIANQQCLLNGGEVVDARRDGGAANPMSRVLLDSYLTAPMWRDAPSGTWTNSNTAERLVLYPICAVRRKTPTAELIAGLDSLNENFTEELRRIADADDDLRRSMTELLLDISSIFASALDSEDGAAPTIFTVSAEFMERARAVADAVRSRTSDERLIAEIDRLIDHGDRLTGTPLSELIPALRTETESAG